MPKISSLKVAAMSQTNTAPAAQLAVQSSSILDSDEEDEPLLWEPVLNSVRKTLDTLEVFKTRKMLNPKTGKQEKLTRKEMKMSFELFDEWLKTQIIVISNDEKQKEKSMFD